MKNKKYYINLTEQERSQITHSLINKKNTLTAQGRYTDAVDKVISENFMVLRIAEDLSKSRREVNKFVIDLLTLCKSLIDVPLIRRPKAGVKSAVVPQHSLTRRMRKSLENTGVSGIESHAKSLLRGCS